MDSLINISLSRINSIVANHKRYLYHTINWNNRMIAITGSRGSGKTTLLLQYIRANLPVENTLYVSLDNIYFSNNRLVDLVKTFVNKGGRYLFLDEVHKYPDWSVEIKNIYDNYPDLKIVFTGSAILELYKGKADLSRRAVSYHLNSLSFREFLLFEGIGSFDAIPLHDILKHHSQITPDLISRFKPLAALDVFYQYGSYPYYLEGKDSYYTKLANTINLIFDYDLPSIISIDYGHVMKLKKLLSIISETVPFKPNISKLAGKIESDRRTIYKYLVLLERANLISLLNAGTKGISLLNKPEKIYFNNTNILYALSTEKPNISTVRETFFYNQAGNKHLLKYTPNADFMIDNKYIIEVSGRNKGQKQIKNTANSYIAKDDIEHGFSNVVPLWLFGFLY